MSRAPQLALRRSLGYRIFEAIAFVTGGTTLAVYLFPKDISELKFDIADYVVTPVLKMVDPELSHALSLKIASSILIPKDMIEDDAILSSTVWNMEFPNPVGLAAGYDKNGVAVGGLLDLGFSFVEVGSVTPQPQSGNPPPRVFRLREDRAVINRYGFNSDGVANVKVNMRNYENSRTSHRLGFVGINAGKNKVTPDDRAQEDFAAVIDTLGPSADYVVVNLSSPNTPGLRALQRREALGRVLRACGQARDRARERKTERQRAVESILHTSSRTGSIRGEPHDRLPPHNPHLPLLVKIAPDLTAEQRQDIAEVVLSMPHVVDGLIVGNTTVSRPQSLQSLHATETGGLSGEPLRELSTQAIHDMYVLTKGKVPIVGVGGISCGQDAYDKIAAGASLVQMYTMLAFDGPGTVRKTKRELKKILEIENHSSLSDAVGCRTSLRRLEQSQIEKLVE